MKEFAWIFISMLEARMSKIQLLQDQVNTKIFFLQQQYIISSTT